jgi:hypothetical protein
MNPRRMSNKHRMAQLAIALLMPICITASAAAQSLYTTAFTAAASGEAVAEIQASAPGASWDKPGAEAASVSISLDGAYNQDVMLFLGAQSSTYRVFLGPVAAGKHQVSIARNERCSAAGAGSKIEGARIRVVTASDPDFAALAHAPILYARADTLGRFSDIPLILYWERLPSPDGDLIQYSVIFTNEDSGTPSDALMARWGHASDIEYVYRVTLDDKGGIRDETYQAPDHKNLRFAGKRVGEHPLLLIATMNNVFTDTGFTAVQYRLMPQKQDLSAATRESVMDRNPWSFRVMSQELEREGKLRDFGKDDGTKIGDPRTYLWIDARLAIRGDVGVAAWAKVKNDGRWRSSTRGRHDVAISRNGWVRTTIELPPGTRAEDVESLAFECADVRSGSPTSPALGDCSVEPQQAFFLDQNYVPGKNLLRPSPTVTIHAGEMTNATIAH